METIFDHHATPEEVAKLFGNPEINREKLLSFGLSKNQHYIGIYKLYLLRKEIDKANEYLDKIPNTLTKRFTICNHDFAK